MIPQPTLNLLIIFLKGCNFFGTVPLNASKKNLRKIFSWNSSFVVKRNGWFIFNLIVIFFLAVGITFDYKVPHVLDADLPVRFFMYFGISMYPFMFFLDYFYYCQPEFLYYLNAVTHYAFNFEKNYKIQTSQSSTGKDKCYYMVKNMYIITLVGNFSFLCLVCWYAPIIFPMCIEYGNFLVGTWLINFIPKFLFTLLSLGIWIGTIFAITGLYLRSIFLITLLLMVLFYGRIILNITSEFSKTPTQQFKFLKFYRELQILAIIANFLLKNVVGIGLVIVVGAQVTSGILLVGRDFGLIIRFFALYYFLMVNFSASIAMNGASALRKKSKIMIGIYRGANSKIWKWKKCISKVVSTNDIQLRYIVRFKKSCQAVGIIITGNVYFEQDAVCSMDEFVADKIATFVMVFGLK